MDFWQTVLVIFRRWYLAGPALAISLLASAAVYETLPSHYVSSSTLVLTAPTNGGAVTQSAKTGETLVTDQNPLLNFDQGLGMSAALLIQALSSPDTAVEVGVHPGDDTTVSVTNGSSNPEDVSSGPFVFVSVDTTSAAGAVAIVQAIDDQAAKQLLARQKSANAPEGTYITVGVVVPPTTPMPEHKSKSRAAAAFLALGLVASLSAAYGGESLSQYRKRRKARKDKETAAKADAAAAGGRFRQTTATGG